MGESLMKRPHAELTQAERDYRATVATIENMERRKLLSAEETQILLARARNLFLN